MSGILAHAKQALTGTSLGARSLRRITCLLLLFLAFECITVDFDWPEQAALGMLTILLTFAINSISKSELVTLTLMFASMIATARYAYWRCNMVLQAATDPGQQIGRVSLVFMMILLAAELYAVVILFLGYVQTIRPLRRPPVPLPADPGQWPHVDVLIPTYNEPLSVVRATAFVAMNIDYPSEKLHVYVLDDGRREDFRQFCLDADIGYFDRKDNRGAKAGNINHALARLNSPYVAIFDCDHVPTRSFLQVTLGWFLKDRKLGMLQTPHFFYSPDPFERNLSQGKAIPNEGELFYGVLQDGNDLWDATFFCGSCAVLRRSALDEIGGIATETVTEDAHTSLRMQMHGWGTAYINIPQAAGLATESLSSHVSQRIRWARGMVQVLRTDNPLSARGLKWPQRLCYFNAMIHFLYGAPRLIFLTAPLVYMLLGQKNIPGYWVAILAYAIPHLLLANVTNFRIQGQHRHSFWNEVYETVLAPYILGPTLLAMINPKLGKFNVTAKGGIVEKSYFDAHIARPYVFLILLNVLALVIAPLRYILWDAGHPGTVIMNVVWILFNMTILGTANAVAVESRQLRGNVRIDQHIPVELRLPDGRSIFGKSLDISLGGAALKLEKPLDLPRGSAVRVVYPLREMEASLPALIVRAEGLSLRLAYAPLSIEEEELLSLVLYSGADTWLTREDKREADRPMHSLARLIRLSVKGVGYALLALLPRRKALEAPTAARAAVTMALAAVLLAAAAAVPLHAAPAYAAVRHASRVAQHGEEHFESSFTLNEIGLAEAIQLRGGNVSRNIRFTLPQTQVVQTAKLNLSYAFSPGLVAQVSHLGVLLNGTQVATLSSPAQEEQAQQLQKASVTLPAQLLARNNVLSFEFIDQDTASCDHPVNPALWGRVETDSTIELAGSLLPLADDLKLLPLPFFDSEVSNIPATIPFAFAVPPSSQALQAAGIMASWFGMGTRSRAMSFPVTLGGVLPKGDIVLFVEDRSALPRGLDLEGGGPIVALRTNPNSPASKVLIIAGDDAAQMLTAARSVALESSLLIGRTAHITDLQMPAPRLANDAPSWLRTDRVAPLWSYEGDAELAGDGSGALPLYVRIPPGLYYGDKTSIPLRLGYRYNAVPVEQGSNLRLSLNGAAVRDLALTHENSAAKSVDADVSVPLSDLRPFANTFLFNFYLQQPKKGPCDASAVSNLPGNLPGKLSGAILRNSSLDLRGARSWAAMPDLELLANAGFPFTRFADLAETMVVLPPKPSAEEVGVYLVLLGHFGAQTGYPALRVSVGSSTNADAAMDYLVLGTPSDQPAFARLSEQLSISMRTDSASLKDSASLLALLRHAWWRVVEMRPDWWKKLNESDARSELMANLSQSPDAVIEAIETPWARGRSLITMTFQGDEGERRFTQAFLKSSASGDINGSVSILRDGAFSSYRLDDKSYYVGELPWWWRVRYWFKEFPWMIVALTFLPGLLVLPWVEAGLNRRVKARLAGNQP